VPTSRGKLSANWDLIGKALEVIPNKIDHNAREVLEECGRIYLEHVMALIDSGGDGTWPALSPEWVATKGHAEFYKFRELFINALGTRRIKATQGTYRLFAGASPYKRHKNAEMSMANLAKILEEQYNRPLFGPAWERARWEIERELAKINDVF